MVFLVTIHSFSRYSNILFCIECSSTQFTGWMYRMGENSPYTKPHAIVIKFNHWGTFGYMSRRSLMQHTQADVPACSLWHASEHLRSYGEKGVLHSSAKLFFGCVVKRSQPSPDTTTQGIARCRIVKARWWPFLMVNHAQSGGLHNPYPTAFPHGNGMVLHFYQQQESSTTKTVHKVINKGLKAYV